MTDSLKPYLKATESAVSLEADEWSHRKRLSDKILGAFITLNSVIAGGVLLIYLIELALVSEKIISPDSRVIDQKIFITLISATTVQFGAIAFAVSKWLFPDIRRAS